MHLNRLGIGCTGFGGATIAWIDGRRLQIEPTEVGVGIVGHQGGMWLNDEEDIFQSVEPAGTAAIHIVTYNIRTQAIKTLSPRGANHGFAGGGRYQLWLGGYGSYGSLGYHPMSSPAGCDFDGNIAEVPEYATGYGLRIYSPDGRVTEAPSDHVYFYGLHVTGPTSCVWGWQGEFYSFNCRLPKQAGPSGGPIPFKVNGEDWIGYWCNNIGVVVHPYDSLEGYLIYPNEWYKGGSEGCWWADFVGVDGKIRVTYSHGSGEYTGGSKLELYDIDPNDARTNFESGYMPTQSASSRVIRTNNAVSIVVPQLGLLEDDIVYRLALLASNILQPLKEKYPNIVVISGLRAPNTSIGQHELGEAVDLKINNQTPELLYEVAEYIRTNLPFDQLVLNFSNVGDKEPWIHVSFSPKSLRGQVLTKDFADVFHDGLFIVDALSAEEAAAKKRSQQDSDKQIMSELTNMQTRAKRLAPATADQEGSSSTSSVGAADFGSITQKSTKLRVVTCVYDALGLQVMDFEGETKFKPRPDHWIELTKRVAWLLRDEHAGLLIDTSATTNDSIFVSGYKVVPNQICYPDGSVFEICGVPGVYWEPKGFVDTSHYLPAPDPGTDYGIAWTFCTFAEPTTTANTTSGGVVALRMRNNAPGIWCDVFQFPDGTFGFAYCDNGGDLVVEHEDGTLVERISIPTGWAGYLRAACSPSGTVCVVAHSQSDTDLVYLSGVGFIASTGACYSRPIVRWDLDAFDVVMPRTATTYSRYRVSEAGSASGFTTGDNPQSSQGFTGFTGDGSPIMRDTIPLIEHPDGNICYAEQSNDVIVGQGATDPGGLRVIVDGYEFTLDHRDPPYDPHVVGDSTRFAVSAYEIGANPASFFAVLSYTRPR